MEHLEIETDEVVEAAVLGDMALRALLGAIAQHTDSPCVLVTAPQDPQMMRATINALTALRRAGESMGLLVHAECGASAECVLLAERAGFSPKLVHATVHAVQTAALGL